MSDLDKILAGESVRDVISEKTSVNVLGTGLSLQFGFKGIMVGDEFVANNIPQGKIDSVKHYLDKKVADGEVKKTTDKAGISIYKSLPDSSGYVTEIWIVKGGFKIKSAKGK